MQAGCPDWVGNTNKVPNAITLWNSKRVIGEMVGKRTGKLAGLDRLDDKCRATIKVRIPDNQDEKVVAGLVSQGGL